MQTLNRSSHANFAPGRDEKTHTQNAAPSPIVNIRTWFANDIDRIDSIQYSKGENETGKRRKKTSWAIWNIAFNLLACDLAVGLRYLLERSHFTEQITETDRERERWRENLDHTQEYSWCSCRSDLKRCMPPFLSWMQALFSRIFAQIFYLAFRLYFRCMFLPSIESIENGVFSVSHHFFRFIFHS